MNGHERKSVLFGVLLLMVCRLMFGSALANAGTAPQAPLAAQKRWILITLDGVARADFCDPRNFSQAWSRLRTELAWSGCSQGGAPSQISNTSAKSLPAYRSMMLGRRESGCTDNFCGRIREESILERMQRMGGWDKQQVAVFGSWPKIGDAAAQRPDQIQVNVGTQAANLVSGDAQSKARVAELNRLQSKDTPPWNKGFLSPTRWDRYTWEHAVIYRGAVDPKVLWIALDDADEWAHRGDRIRYLNILKTYDQWLAALIDQVSREDQTNGTETRVLVTTDHGRGLGGGWTDHDSADGESRYLWMLERVPGVAGGDVVRPEPHLWIGESLLQAVTPFGAP